MDTDRERTDAAADLRNTRPEVSDRADARSRLRVGGRTLLALLVAGLFGPGAMAQVTLDLVVLVDGEPASLQPAGAWADDDTLAERDGNTFTLLRPSERLELAFDGGSAALAAADIGSWDLAHVLAVRVQRQSNGNYRFDVTVRHRDEGWDHYADRWQVSGAGVGNGERVLLHPHDTEQPFTRSQSDVVAQGEVTIEANDLVHGLGGSTITLDLDALASSERTIEIQVERRD